MISLYPSGFVEVISWTAALPRGQVVTSPAEAAVITASTAQTSAIGSNEKLTFSPSGFFGGMNGNNLKVTLSSGVTASDVVDAIHNAPVGSYITASRDGSGHLVLTSKQTGADQSFSVVSNKSAAADQSGLGNSTLTGTGSDAESSSGSGGLEVQVGVEGDEDSRISVTIDSLRADDLGISGLSVSSVSGARDALSHIDDALDAVSSVRGSLGTDYNRFSIALEHAATMRENTAAAASQIRDVDFAEATSEMTSQMIIRKAGVAALSQASSAGAAVLKLLT